MNRALRTATVLGLPGLIGLTAATAQTAPTAGSTTALIQQQRQIEDKLAADRVKVGGAPSILDWQWGGWIEYFYFNFDDGVQSSRQLHRPGLVLWSRLAFDNNNHEIFARMRLRYDNFNPGDEYLRQEDWVGPEFDRLWYNVDVLRALRLADEDSPLRVRARIGRQPVIFGTGFALDLPLDAVVIQTDLKQRPGRLAQRPRYARPAA
jgi:hypothetical protein